MIITCKIKGELNGFRLLIDCGVGCGRRGKLCDKRKKGAKWRKISASSIFRTRFCFLRTISCPAPKSNPTRPLIRQGRQDRAVGSVTEKSFPHDWPFHPAGLSFGHQSSCTRRETNQRYISWIFSKNKQKMMRRAILCLAAVAIDVHSKTKSFTRNEGERQGLPELITVQMTIQGRCWPAPGAAFQSEISPGASVRQIRR